MLNQELKSLKDELKQTRKANKMAEAEKAEAEKDVSSHGAEPVWCLYVHQGVAPQRSDTGA